MLRVSVAGILLAAAVALPGHAQTQQSCVDVEVGSARSYDCLNKQLQAAAHQAQRFSSGSTATAPGNVTGQFNESATRNRLGDNFGKSVTPQRPK